MRRFVSARSVAFEGVQRTGTSGRLKRSVSAVALLVAMAGYAGGAQAQAVGGAAPPVKSSIDANGVDLTRGTFTISTVDLAVGQGGLGGLAYSRSFRDTAWRDNQVGTINSSGVTYTVSIGAGSGTFTLAGSTFTSQQADGSSLTFNATTQVYTYTTRDGVVALFSKALAETAPLEANEGKVTSITAPSGEKQTFTYKTVTVGGVNYNRLQSVTNNLGYQLKFEYSLASPATVGQLPDFRNISRVTGLNNAVDYCDPAADSCSFSQVWPSAAYARPTGTTSTVTDGLSRVTRYTYDVNGRITGVKRPSSASADTATIAYDTLGQVSSVSNGAATWTYVYPGGEEGGAFITSVTDPVSNTRSVTSSGGQVMWEINGAGKATTYAHDGSGRLTKVTEPEGNYLQYAYDARGNITTETRGPKPGSGLGTEVKTWAYDSSCANVVTCNKPNSFTDSNSAVTSYTYDATHGAPLTISGPNIAFIGPNQYKVYSYTPLYAWYKNSAGVVAQAATPIYRQTNLTGCVAPGWCLGAEPKTVTAYGAPGVANNLLPTLVTQGSEDGSLAVASAMTYDNVGNQLTVDGPLAGTADTTRYRYDAARQLVGVVGPDPDGGGALKHRGSRTTFDADGRVTAVEMVAVNSQSDGDWASPTVLQRTTSDYDSLGRLAKTSVLSGGVTYAVTQYSYDAANRLDCTAVRMNPATFGALPAACTLATTGSDGPDRITRTTWDNADRPSKITLAYGTLAQQDERTFTYTNNGQIATLADALGGLTTYEYDGFDQLKKIRYPNPGSRTTSSTTDYEEFGYGAGNRTSERRRDGTTVSIFYDSRRNPTSRSIGPGNCLGTPRDAYDRLVSGSTCTGTDVNTFQYDALGRMTSESSPLGTIGYQYDAAGRRTRITWADGFYVTYDYDVVGAVTAIRENGATSGAGVLATYAYDDAGRRASVTRGNGVTTGYSYDGVSRMTGLAHDLAGTSADQTYTIAYNAAFQARSRTGSNSAYDLPSPGASSRSYGSNGLNQMTTSGPLTVTSDSKGNLSSDGVNSYSYNAHNQLIGVSGATLSYDPVGRLYETVGAATTRFAYSGADLIGEYNSSGGLLRRYVPGPGGDEPLVWYEGAGTGDRRWLAADPLGSIVSVSSVAGSSLAANAYDEFGAPGGGNLGRYSYTGQIWLPEAGLLHYKARAYSPVLGRYAQTDPAGYVDGANLYAYVGNDPINLVDPTGLILQQLDYRYPRNEIFPEGNGPSWMNDRWSSACRWAMCFGEESTNSDGSVTVSAVVVTAKPNSRMGRTYGVFERRSDYFDAWKTCMRGTISGSGALYAMGVGAVVGGIEGAKWGAAGFVGGPTGFGTVAAGAFSGAVVGAAGAGLGYIGHSALQCATVGGGW